MTYNEQPEDPSAPALEAATIEQPYAENRIHSDGLNKTEINQEAQSAAIQLALDRQRLIPALIAGAIAALLGAVIWAGLILITNMEIAYVAVGIGFLVGIVVRVVGRGFTLPFAILGALLAFISVITGKYFAILGNVAETLNMTYLDTAKVLDFEMLKLIANETFSMFDFVFYGLAIWLGFKTSIMDPHLAMGHALDAKDKEEQSVYNREPSA